MNTAKISVQVTVYNKELYLTKCLNSILDQTLKDIEIVCVDDASTDNSLSILKDYQKKDNRIKIFKHSRNRGKIHARKTAFMEANGDFMVFVDADDFIEPDMCELLYKKAIRELADFVQFNGQIYDPEHILTKTLYQRYNNRFSKGVDCKFEGNEIFKHYALPIRNNLCLSMYKKNLYKKVIPFISDDAPLRGDDSLLSFFLMYYARKYIFCNKIFYNYRASNTSDNLNNISLNLAKSQIEGRSKVIFHAKSFAEANNLKWDNHEAPFFVLSRILVGYSADFMNRCYEAAGKEKEDLIRHFGDCFGGEALLFFLKEIENLKTCEYCNNTLRKALSIIYSSKLWKTKKSLQWRIRKL
jgi:glycosyltransferase involved in cell wall biosynthesis